MFYLQARLIFYHSRRGVALHLTCNSGNDYMALPKKIYRKVEKVKKERERGGLLKTYSTSLTSRLKISVGQV
jgi:hypothetical protein